MWQHWINGILGLWTIVASYLYLSGMPQVVMYVTGVVVAILAFWGAATTASSMESGGRGRAQHSM